jgi:GTPase SAR1 family protein
MNSVNYLVVIICFNVGVYESFYNVTERWHPETRHFLSNVPVILVGTMIDLRPVDEETVDPLEERKDSKIEIDSGTHKVMTTAEV